MKHLLFAILILLTLSCFGETAKVTRVIDGDTFETETGERVRLVGINAPEINDLFGQEAKQHLISLLENRTVNLESDNISNDRDVFGRLLRYVIINGSDLNKQMVLDGFAIAYLKYRFDREVEYSAAEMTAKQNKIGIWSLPQKDGSVSGQNTDKSISTGKISAEVYLIGGLIILLVIIGCYYYFRK